MDSHSSNSESYVMFNLCVSMVHIIRPPSLELVLLLKQRKASGVVDHIYWPLSFRLSIFIFYKNPFAYKAQKACYHFWCKFVRKTNHEKIILIFNIS